jgi:hypothetical protein
MNTANMKKGASKGGAAATGDKKRRNLVGIKHRRETSGDSSSRTTGWEIGISLQVSRACLEYFGRKGIVYRAEWQ